MLVAVKTTVFRLIYWSDGVKSSISNFGIIKRDHVFNLRNVLKTEGALIELRFVGFLCTLLVLAP